MARGLALRLPWTKYRTLLISIALFLFFDLGVLVPNFILSSKIKQDAIAIDLAGRQRMLSQRQMKALLQIQVNLAAGESITQSRRELALVSQLFDETLQGFAQGGRATGGNGQPVQLDAAQTPRGQQLVDEALALWQPYRAKLAPILQDPLQQELEQKGVEVEPIRWDDLTGKWFAFFKDPDGLPLELYQA